MQSQIYFWYVTLILKQDPTYTRQNINKHDHIMFLTRCWSNFFRCSCSSLQQPNYSMRQIPAYSMQYMSSGILWFINQLLQHHHHLWQWLWFIELLIKIKHIPNFQHPRNKPSQSCTVSKQKITQDRIIYQEEEEQIKFRKVKTIAMTKTVDNN